MNFRDATHEYYSFHTLINISLQSKKYTMKVKATPAQNPIPTLSLRLTPCEKTSRAHPKTPPAGGGPDLTHLTKNHNSKHEESNNY